MTKKCNVPVQPCDADCRHCAYGFARVEDVSHFQSATVIFLEGGGAITILPSAVYGYRNYPNDPALAYTHDNFIDTLDNELKKHGAQLVRGKYGRTSDWEYTDAP